MFGQCRYRQTTALVRDMLCLCFKNKYSDSVGTGKRLPSSATCHTIRSTLYTPRVTAERVTLPLLIQDLLGSSLEGLTPVTDKIAIFWYVTACS
jgi:hypothetical protein